MDYAYVKAYDIFKRNFQIGDLIPLFRELKSRDVCPENWERQIKFWSMLIKAWGNNSNVIEFSVDKLSQALVFQEVIPPLRPTIEYLVTTKVIIPCHSLLSNKSLYEKVKSKILNFVNFNNVDNDKYVFSNNLKELCKKIVFDIESIATFSTDVILTNEEIKNKFLIENDNPLVAEADFEVIKAGFNTINNVKTYENGIYVQSSRYSNLSSDLINAVLSSKIILNNLENNLEQIKEKINNELERAKKYLKQKKKNYAINALRRKKSLETQEKNMNGMYENLSRILHQLAENEFNKTIFQDIDQINKTTKLMQQPDVNEIDNTFMELEDQMLKSSEISDALAKEITTGFDELEIEEELNNLIEEEGNDTQTISHQKEQKHALLT